LASDAVILENGDQETREEYSSHHLTADIEFAQAVPARLSAMQVTVNGDVAWASSITVMQGAYHGRVINSTGAELMVLSRTATSWEIRSIHWSSRTLHSGR
jgi:ketosteroid isomerase-like protein